MSMLVSVFQQHQSSPNIEIPFLPYRSYKLYSPGKKKWCPATQEGKKLIIRYYTAKEQSGGFQSNPCKETGVQTFSYVSP